MLESANPDLLYQTGPVQEPAADARQRFEPHPNTVIQSIVQRSLLKWWNDQRARRMAPARSEIDPYKVVRCWNDVAMYEVVRGKEGSRYRFRWHGEGISLADGADYRGRYLDEALPEAMRPSILAAYDAILRLKCPLYTVRPAVDANGIALRFERLLLPFSSDGRQVDDVLTHIHMFCPQGGYERRRLFEASLTFKDHTVRAALSEGNGKTRYTTGEWPPSTLIAVPVM